MNRQDFLKEINREVGPIYLAGPYSDPSKVERELRYCIISAVALVLAEDGMVVFSPVSQWHPIAVRSEMPTDYAFWSCQNRGMLEVCNQLVVLKMKGWDSSVGVRDEIKYAMELEKKVTFVEMPDILVIDLLDATIDEGLSNLRPAGSC